MTKSNAAGRVGNCHNLVVNNVINYGPSDCSYRLWHSDKIFSGKPNTILVHGAVIPPGHVRERPNYCFRQLGPLLQKKQYGQHNVWDFEYANTLSHLTGFYFNYGDLNTYSNGLKDVIQRVKELNQGSKVNIVAHSLGGLIARCAGQDEAVDKIVTLDTGHFGFEVAHVADVFVKNLPKDIQTNALCAEQTPPGSEFIYTLAKNFKHGRAKLLSLAAGEKTPVPLPPWPPVVWVTVVRLTSSSLVEVSGDGSVSYDSVNTPYVIKDVNHLTIALIDNIKHPAFQLIEKFLNDRFIDQNLSHPSGNPYFTVVLGKQPETDYPATINKDVAVSRQNRLCSHRMLRCYFSSAKRSC